MNRLKKITFHDPDARLFLHYGDLSDSGQLTNFVLQGRGIYNKVTLAEGIKKDYQ